MTNPDKHSLPLLELDAETVEAICDALADAKARHDVACALRDDIDNVDYPICMTVEDPRLGPVFFIACQRNPLDENPESDYEIAVMTSFVSEPINPETIADIAEDSEASEEIRQMTGRPRRPVLGH